jgi:hypothetical protein
MTSTVEIDAGICGFKTTAVVASEDGQAVSFEVQSDCEKIRDLGEQLRSKGAIDAYQEISTAKESVLMTTVRATLKGCCAGCAVPAGLFKAMQVAAGLALPKDVTIRLAKGAGPSCGSEAKPCICVKATRAIGRWLRPRRST